MVFHHGTKLVLAPFQDLPQGASLPSPFDILPPFAEDGGAVGPWRAHTARRRASVQRSAELRSEASIKPIGGTSGRGVAGDVC